MSRPLPRVPTPPLAWLSGRQLLGMRLYDDRRRSQTVVDLSLDCSTMHVTDCVCETRSATPDRPHRRAVPWAGLVIERASQGNRVEARVAASRSPPPLLRAGGLRADGPRVEASAAPAVPTAHVQLRLRRMLGMTVVDSAHRRLGRVDDVVVERDGAKIPYLLLSFGGFAGIGRRRALVPAGSLRLPRDATCLVLPFDRERLASLAVAATPRMAYAEWLAAACRRLETGDTLRASTHAAAGTGGADAGSEERARATHGFGALEDRVHGTVLTTESSSRQRKGAPRQRLRLRMDSGREVTVLMASLDDKAQANLAVRVGQVVEVRGWWAEQGAQSIMVARGMTIDGRTIAIDDVPRDEVWMPQ
jgi:sporulation protein YlmC with PRC-barrel domain